MKHYLVFSFSMAFISWIIGMLIHAFVVKMPFYQKHLVNFNFIKPESVNTYLGLNVFKWVLLHSFFKFFNPKLSFKKTIKASELIEYRKEMTMAELNHLFAFVFMSGFMLIELIRGHYLFALIMLLVNMLMNIYPALLQQQNKRRIDRCLRIIEIKITR